MRQFTLTVSNMPGRDKKGWVKQDEKFMTAESRDGYGTSKQTLTFLLENGIYEVQDANFGSSHVRRYWLKVEDGEGVEIDRPKHSLELLLPGLEGSVNQVNWALTIRRIALIRVNNSLLISNKELLSICLRSTPSNWCLATFWIENRKWADSIVQEWLENEVKKHSYPYPKKKWKEDAHEGKGGEWCYYCKGLKSQVFVGEGNDLMNPVFCYNPDTLKWEVWHYVP